MRATFKHGVTKVTQQITLNHGGISVAVTATMIKKYKRETRYR